MIALIIPIPFLITDLSTCPGQWVTGRQSSHLPSCSCRCTARTRWRQEPCERTISLMRSPKQVQYTLRRWQSCPTSHRGASTPPPFPNNSYPDPVLKRMHHTYEKSSNLYLKRETRRLGGFSSMKTKRRRIQQRISPSLDNGLPETPQRMAIVRLPLCKCGS